MLTCGVRDELRRVGCPPPDGLLTLPRLGLSFEVPSRRGGRTHQFASSRLSSWNGAGVRAREGSSDGARTREEKRSRPDQLQRAAPRESERGKGTRAQQTERLGLSGVTICTPGGSPPPSDRLAGVGPGERPPSPEEAGPFAALLPSLSGRRPPLFQKAKRVPRPSVAREAPSGHHPLSDGRSAGMIPRVVREASLPNAGGRGGLVVR